MNNTLIIYKEIVEYLETSDCMGVDSYSAEFKLQFTKLGLHSGGTFVFEDHPSGEELSIVEHHGAEWAVVDRFEEFADEVSSWTRLQRYINLTQNHEEICQALNFLQSYGTSATQAQQLLLVQAFKVWEQQQALLANVSTTTKPAKTTIKI